ncbi:MAG TPA: aldo/keto reductase [Spirochaetia bacterium]|nr:aldo/keto reductase [Spirochaetia bacterium]
MPVPVGNFPLGKTSILVSPLGIGTNAWGRAGRPRPELRQVFEAALSRGINFFDTAEVYGGGGSERTLGAFLAGSRAGGERPVVLSKFFPMPWRLRKGALIDALKRSLDRLRLPSLDVYLIHFPWGPVAIETWVDALADAASAGLVRAVGVSNYTGDQVRRAHAVLASRSMPLACNEVELSLARRGAEKNGTLAACRELGVTVIAYRPLALGRLTGVSSKPAHGWRKLMASSMGSAVSLADTLQEIGRAHEGRSASQVALNWVICKGALPIPGATSVEHLQENAGVLGWRLSESDVAALDAAAGHP